MKPLEISIWLLIGAFFMFGLELTFHGIVEFIQSLSVIVMPILFVISIYVAKSSIEQHREMVVKQASLDVILKEKQIFPDNLLDELKTLQGFYSEDIFSRILRTYATALIEDRSPQQIEFAPINFTSRQSSNFLKYIDFLNRIQELCAGIDAGILDDDMIRSKYYSMCYGIWDMLYPYVDELRKHPHYTYIYYATQIMFIRWEQKQPQPGLERK